MLNAATYGKKVLTALLNQGWTLNSNAVTNPYNNTSMPAFPTTVYLAFSTKTPTVNSSTGVVSGFVEPTTGNYARIDLTKKGFGNTKLLSAADVVERDVTVEDGETTIASGTRYVSRIRNHEEYIIGNYTGETGDGWGTDPVTHFGIYDAITGGNLVFWGPLKSSVSVPADRVPIILIDNFEITLG